MADIGAEPRLGNPTALALAGFSTSVFLVNSHIAGYMPGTEWISASALLSGVGLLIGCFYNYLHGNSILVTNFGIYGSMWMSISVLMFKDPTADLDNIMVYIRIPILVYSAMALVAASHGNTAVLSLFISLDINLLFLIIAQLHGGAALPATNILMRVGAGAGVWCALSGFYMSASLTLAPYVSLPMGPALIKPHLHVQRKRGTSSRQLLQKLQWRFSRRRPDPEQDLPQGSQSEATHAPMPARAHSTPAEKRDSRGDPRALGLSGYGCIAVMYSAYYIGWIHTFDWVSPLSMLAAITQLLAMILHLNSGSSVHAVNCGFYGAFWLAVSLHLLSAQSAQDVSGDVSSALVSDYLDGPLTYVRIACAIFTSYSIAATAFISGAYCLIYATFEMQLLLLIIGHLCDAPSVMRAAGWFGLLSGALAFYMAASLYLRVFFEMPFWSILGPPFLTPRRDAQGEPITVCAWLGLCCSRRSKAPKSPAPLDPADLALALALADGHVDLELKELRLEQQAPVREAPVVLMSDVMETMRSLRPGALGPVPESSHSSRPPGRKSVPVVSPFQSRAGLGGSPQQRDVNASSLTHHMSIDPAAHHALWERGASMGLGNGYA